MIQRIQTIYLVLASALSVVCMRHCIGYFSLPDGELSVKLYSLFYVLIEDGERVGSDFRFWALFAIMLIVATITFLNIFLYRQRALQMRICSFSMILLACWYAAYAAFVWVIKTELASSFRPGVVASLPLVAIILLYLAFRGIMKDEKLVRSLDRLR